VRKRHVVVLSEEERARLHTLIGRGVAPARVLTHARILLKANQGEAGPGWTDADQATLEWEVAAWQAARNASGRGVDWRFTTEDARIKLKHLYPTIQD